MNPLVSVITPVLNSEETIKIHMDSIAKQNYLNIEHIIVDNYSNDSTPEIVKKYNIKYYQCGPERVAQDNFGVSVSKGEYVYISASDMYVDPNYVSSCVKQCEENGFDAIYASVISKTTNYLSRVKGLERDIYVGDNLHESARFFKKEVFIKAGMFNDQMVLHGDDYEMQKRLDDQGYKTGRIEEREVHLDELDNWSEVVFKSFYYGFNSIEYIKKYKFYAIKQLSPVRGVFFKRLDLFIRNLNLLPGFILFKFIQYFFASFGLFCAYFKLGFISNFFHKKIYRVEKE